MRTTTRWWGAVLLVSGLATGCTGGEIVPPEQRPMVGAAATHDPFPWIELDEDLGGEAAVTALVDDLDAIEAEYGLQTGSLAKMFRGEKSLRVNRDGLLYFAEEASFGDGLPLNPAPDQIPDVETFKLNSKPGSRATIYLDFLGGTVTTAYWNGGVPITSGPYSTDADPAFSPSEMLAIRTIWLMVAEDFAAFDVNVTTELPVAPDMTRFTRIALWPTTFYGSSGGVCYLDSFSWGMASMDPQTCWVFVSLHGYNIKNIAEATSHEIGHAFGLKHWNQYDASGAYLAEYYAGAGSWAPIMGVGYYRPITQWSRGEYAGAGAGSSTSRQDDVAVIARYAPVRADDAAATRSNAPLAWGTASGGVVSIDHRGLLTTAGDVDLVRLETSGGPLSLSLLPARYRPDADTRMRLLDGAGAVLAEADPAGIADITLSLPSVAAGSYYVEVTGVGAGDPKVDGYSNYGSLGGYELVGSYAGTVAGTPPATPTTPPPSGDTVAPTAAIIAPTAGGSLKARARAYITARVADANALSAVTISVNGATICSVGVVASTDVTCEYRVPNKPGTQASIVVRATDAAGNVGSSSATVVSIVR